MGSWTDQVVKFLLTYLSQGDHMNVLIAFLLGAILGGLVDRFIVPFFWKPKV